MPPNPSLHRSIGIARCRSMSGIVAVAVVPRLLYAATASLARPQSVRRAAMATTRAIKSPPGSSTKNAARHDRLFYSGMATALGLTVLAGFASTYYLQFFADGPKATLTGGPFTALVHVHGVLFTVWMLAK